MPGITPKEWPSEDYVGGETTSRQPLDVIDDEEHIPAADLGNSTQPADDRTENS